MKTTNSPSDLVISLQTIKQIMSESESDNEMSVSQTFDNDSDQEKLNDDQAMSSDDESENEEGVDLTKKIYNTQAILQKLEEIKRDDNIPWIEFPVINSGFIHENVDAEDDFEREVSFYKQTIAGCEEARVRLETAGIKYKRPDDFFAEMLKTDAHMAKVRQSLLDQQRRIEAVEERRKQRELKQRGKAIQVEKEKTRAQQKKAEIEAVKKWRKGNHHILGEFSIKNV